MPTQCVNCSMGELSGWRSSKELSETVDHLDQLDYPAEKSKRDFVLCRSLLHFDLGSFPADTIERDLWIISFDHGLRLFHLVIRCLELLETEPTDVDQQTAAIIGDSARCTVLRSHSCRRAEEHRRDWITRWTLSSTTITNHGNLVMSVVLSFLSHCEWSRHWNKQVELLQ